MGWVNVGFRVSSDTSSPKFCVTPLSLWNQFTAFNLLFELDFHEAKTSSHCFQVCFLLWLRLVGTCLSFHESKSLYLKTLLFVCFSSTQKLHSPPTPLPKWAIKIRKLMTLCGLLKCSSKGAPEKLLWHVIN